MSHHLYWVPNRGGDSAIDQRRCRGGPTRGRGSQGQTCTLGPDGCAGTGAPGENRPRAGAVTGAHSFGGQGCAFGPLCTCWGDYEATRKLYLPAVNNYWARTAFVALVYFSEMKRDTEITVTHCDASAASAKPPTAKASAPQPGHPPAAAWTPSGRSLDTLRRQPALTKDMKMTHVFKAFFFFTLLNSFQHDSWTFLTPLSLSKCEFEA